MAKDKAPKDEIAEDMADSLPDLTPSQMGFVQGLLAGKTGIASYEDAYNVEGMSKASRWAASSRLRAHSKIAAWLRAARIAHLGAGLITKDNHLRELERLREQALHAGNYSAAVNCEIAKGKAAGLYTERVELVDPHPMEALNTIASVDPQLAERMAKDAGLDYKVPAPGDATKH